MSFVNDITVIACLYYINHLLFRQTWVACLSHHIHHPKRLDRQLLMMSVLMGLATQMPFLYNITVFALSNFYINHCFFRQTWVEPDAIRKRYHCDCLLIIIIIYVSDRPGLLVLVITYITQSSWIASF